MPLSGSLLAFPDCQKAFERAIDAERGIKLTFKDAKAARMFAFRCNQYRKLDRQENQKIYAEPAHTLHGRSVFDTIRVSVKTDGAGAIVLMEKIKVDAETEDL